MSSFVERVRKSREAVWRIPLLLALIAGGVVVQICTRDYNSSCTLVGNVTNCQCAPVGEWSQIYWYSAVLVITAQLSLTVREFFLGEGPSFWSQMRYLFTGTQASQRAAVSRHQVGFWTLMPSAMISWIFAKSINNAASWGGRFGVMGGVAYAGWYTSFFSAGLVGYWLRTRHGFASLPSAVDRCFGPAGLVCLNLALLFRLWNEIWSNVSVVANFYSDTPRTQAWWLAAIVSGAVPAVYVCMGGMRASLFSDVVQAVLGLFLLFYLMGVVSYEMRAVDVWSWQPVGGYQPGGGTALCAALVQGFLSYPFHDPVLTDRTFLSTPRTMLASFVVGGAIAAMFIILFSAVGILGDYLADPPRGVVGRGDPANVARALCGVTFGIMNLIMMTSSLSTLDSTYTSCSKLIALELVGWARLDARVPRADDRARAGREHQAYCHRPRIDPGAHRARTRLLACHRDGDHPGDHRLGHHGHGPWPAHPADARLALRLGAGQARRMAARAARVCALLRRRPHLWDPLPPLGLQGRRRRVQEPRASRGAYGLEGGRRTVCHVPRRQPRRPRRLRRRVRPRVRRSPAQQLHAALRRRAHRRKPE